MAFHRYFTCIPIDTTPIEEKYMFYCDTSIIKDFFLDLPEHRKEISTCRSQFSHRRKLRNHYYAYPPLALEPVVDMHNNDCVICSCGSVQNY